MNKTMTIKTERVLKNGRKMRKIVDIIGFPTKEELREENPKAVKGTSVWFTNFGDRDGLLLNNRKHTFTVGKLGIRKNHYVPDIIIGDVLLETDFQAAIDHVDRALGRLHTLLGENEVEPVDWEGEEIIDFEPDEAAS